MSGHSKWSKVKHQKEATDAVKGRIFTKMASAIIIAVKEGGGPDPDSNFRLRLAVDKAKSVNMPKENINRAIEKAKGGKGAEIIETLYEAFGPSGVGILIKCATDNKQRTVSEIKNILDRGGGALAGSGAVSHFFNEVGMIEIAKNGQNSDMILEKIINAGAMDYEEDEAYFYIYTSHKDLHKVRVNLSGSGLLVLSAELYFRPVTSIGIENGNEITKIENLLNAIEEREDVLKVFTNYSATAFNV